MVYLAALMLLLGALLLVVNHLLTERRRVRQVNQRLQGHLVREPFRQLAASAGQQQVRPAFGEHRQ
jgi:hypothetical protein